MAEPDLDSPAVSRVREFLRDRRRHAWLVGGTVRDLLLGKQPCDVDLAIADDPRPLARDFADSVGGSFFTMSEEFRACRVVAQATATAGTGAPAGSGAVTWDFVALRGASIEDDLRGRDFTVNAMAVELPVAGAVLDPLGGRADLAAGRLAAASGEIFDHDPLRLLRALRLEKELGLAIDEPLAGLIRDRAPLASRPAAERTFAELTRLLAAPGACAAARRMDSLGLLEVLLPELTALKGISQNDYHHLDVFEHTLANCTALEQVIADPAAFFPGQARQLQQRAHRRLAGDAGWSFMMAFAALMHDIAKPFCRFTDVDGQVRFFEHDRRGGEMVAGILGRMKASAEITRAVAFLVRRHMRFEGLLQQRPPSNRARLRYLRATAPLTPELIMLAVSDRLSVRGRLVTEADIEAHLALTREMMELYFAGEEAGPPPRLVSGDELMRELGLAPGPLIGSLLARIEEEQRLGNLNSRDEALAAAARMLKEEG